MTWFKVDDRFHSHQKVLMLAADGELAALGLWVIAGSWAADQLTDGWIPQYVASRLDADFAIHADALVRVALWECDVRNGIAGWQFHGWNEEGRQPTAEKVLADRKATADRVARFRDRKSNGVTNDVTNGRVTLPRPDPTKVLPTEVLTPAHATEDDIPRSPKRTAQPKRNGIEDPESWERFWRAYPRKKDKGNAERAWNKAIADGATPDEIMNGVLFYRLDCANKEAQYIKYPATWLNARGWQDEPDPAPAPPRAIGAPSEAAAVQPRSFDEMRHEFTPHRQDTVPDFGNPFGMPS